MRIRRFYSVAAFLLVVSCASLQSPAASARSTTQRHGGSSWGSGKASWYEQGGRTASGERFRPAAQTAAHRTLPFGTRLRVINISTGASTIVRVNDRGPAARTGRVVDLSRGAASAIGIIKKGTQSVKLERLD